MLNGRRVDVRHLELAPIAVDDEASKSRFLWFTMEITTIYLV